MNQSPRVRTKQRRKALLTDLGCKLLQGFLLHRSCPRTTQSYAALGRKTAAGELGPPLKTGSMPAGLTHDRKCCPQQDLPVVVSERETSAGDPWLMENPKNCSKTVISWRGGRVVDGSGLENRHTRNGIGGSNPSLSARLLNPRKQRLKRWY
jgi:hypothetical protein